VKSRESFGENLLHDCRQGRLLLEGNSPGGTLKGHVALMPL
jgi:hypothetical protein